MNLRQGGPTGAAADASFGIDQQARVDQANGGFMAVGKLAPAEDRQGWRALRLGTWEPQCPIPRT